MTGARMCTADSRAMDHADRSRRGRLAPPRFRESWSGCLQGSLRETACGTARRRRRAPSAFAKRSAFAQSRPGSARSVAGACPKVRRPRGELKGARP